jgi:cobalt-zinc-cadmium efflux system protein
MTMDAEKRLTLSLGVTAVVFLAEVIGGIVSNSLALLSDAGHIFTDAFAISLSITAARIGRRPSDYRATYGYQRIGLLAAVINGLSLLLIASFIFFESYKRFVSPFRVDVTLMLSIAGFGLFGNIIMAFIIGRKHDDLNIRSAWLHIMGDTLSSIGVIISGLIIYLTGWVYADPIASALIGIIILSGGVRVVKDALTIFLEMAPQGFHAEEIVEELCKIPEVLGVHDVHIWSVIHKRIAFTAHVRVHDQKLSEAERIREKIHETLRGKGISHIILQLECAECATNGLYCQIHEME